MKIFYSYDTSQKLFTVFVSNNTHEVVLMIDRMVFLLASKD